MSNKKLLSDEYTSRSLRYPLLNNELQNLLGEVLTLVDASVSGIQQNKAMKDLIKQRFSDKIHGLFWEYCYRREYTPTDQFLTANIVEGVESHSETDVARSL